LDELANHVTPEDASNVYLSIFREKMRCTNKEIIEILEKDGIED